MTQDVDEQTRTIVEYLTKHEPQLVFQIKWTSSPLMRLLDFLVFGAIGRLFLSLGRKASGPRAIGLLSKAVATTSSKKVMAKALFYRGNDHFGGAVDADRSIADYSLAIWCDPSDCWARKDRASIYEMYQASYGRGDKYFSLPMTLDGAAADAAAAADHFGALARTLSSPEGKERAMRMMQQCEDVARKLNAHRSSA